MQVLCKKNLYRSIYKNNAFVAGKTYQVARQDDLIWIIDEKGREINFTYDSTPIVKEVLLGFNYYTVCYKFDDYFLSEDKISFANKIRYWLAGKF
jgi:hypothetical protein